MENQNSLKDDYEAPIREEHNVWIILSSFHYRGNDWELRPMTIAGGKLILPVFTSEGEAADFISARENDYVRYKVSAGEVTYYET